MTTKQKAKATNNQPTSQSTNQPIDTFILFSLFFVFSFCLRWHSMYFKGMEWNKNQCMIGGQWPLVRSACIHFIVTMLRFDSISFHFFKVSRMPPLNLCPFFSLTTCITLFDDKHFHFICFRHEAVRAL